MPVPLPEESKKPKIKSRNYFPVVGVGASAGGLKAFKQFIHAIPEDSGMAFIIVQHLHPEGHLLPELLKNESRIPVEEIADNVYVEPNHIYVIPSNKLLIATDGVLKLGEKPVFRSGSNMVIDIFFSSLAEVHGNYAIGIILSGKGEDGVKGLREIRDHGGITFAQEPATAEYFSMPNAAIKAGVADFILPPEEMVPELLKLKMSSTLSPYEAKDEEALNEEEYFEQIYALLLIRKDLDFTFYKQTTVRRRIIRRMAILKMETIQDYLAYLKQHKTEQDALFHDMLIPVTEFFRDANAFNTLAETVFPELLKSKSLNNPLRIWVAGCSTGQEVYSLAIALQEFLGEQANQVKIQIFATDISERAIEKARSGIYRKKEMKGVSEKRLQRFFNIIDEGFQIRKQIRDMCVFATHNFLKNPPFAKLDMISCRNVLIYMNSFLQKKAFSIFHYALNEKGYLILGKSETTINSTELFFVFDKKNKIYIRKSVPEKFATITGRPNPSVFRNSGNAHNRPKGVLNDFQKSAEQILLSKYIPPSVIVNDHFDIIQFRGPIGTFLEPSSGKASLNVLRMVRQGLSFELRNALHKAKVSHEPFIREDIPVDNGKRLVTFEVIPLPDTIEPYFLILFKESSPLKPETDGFSPDDKKSIRIAQLEKELVRLREDIRNITEDQEAINEELQSANEELLSDSEELQSLNEELETSTEELQSTNEELLTVNQELFERNSQLEKSRQFSESILATLHEPLILLDKKFRLRNANQAFYGIFELKENESLGKSFFELKNGSWNIPELRKALTKVQKNKIVELELNSEFPGLGKRSICYHLHQIKIETGDLSFLLALDDITERKTVEKAEGQLKERKMLHSFFMQVPAAFCILKGPNHIFELANPIYCELIGNRNPLGKTVREALPELENQGFYELLDEVYQTGKPFFAKGWTAYLMQEDGTLKKTILNFNYQPLIGIDDNIEGILVFAYDVTDQVEAQIKISQSAKKYQDLVESIPAAVYTCDQNGYIQLYNEAAARLWGRRPVIGKEMWCGSRKLFSTDGAPLPLEQCPMAIALREGRISNMELLIQRPDGSIRNVIPYPQPETDQSGNIIGALNTLIDITEQVKARKKIEASEQRFRDMANKVPVLIWVSDAAGQRNFFNKSWQDATGRTFSQDAGMGWLATVHEQDAKMFLEQYTSSIQNRTAFEIEYRLLQQGGHYRWTISRGTPVYDMDGNFTGFLGTCYDIHDQKIKEQKKDEFISIASHEMKTPLTTAKAYLQLTEQAVGATNEQAYLYAKKASSSIDRLHGLISELLDVSKIQHGKLAYNISRFNFNEMLDSTIEGIQYASPKHTIIKKGAVKQEVTGDRNRLQQVLINLLSNAVKYSPDADEVLVHVEEQNGNVKVAVKDKGIGLSQNSLEKIFERYYRVEEHAVQFQGLGIGLFISHEIIRRHKGRLWVESEQGKGSIFYFMIPVHFETKKEEKNETELFME